MSELTNKKLEEHLANSASQSYTIDQSLQAIQSWMRLNSDLNETPQSQQTSPTSRKRTIFHTANIAVMAILNKSSSKKPEIVKVIRPLMILSLKNNFVITSDYLPGISNDLPDKISRFQVSTEDLTKMGLQLTPAPVPLCWTPNTNRPT